MRTAIVYCGSTIMNDYEFFEFEGGLSFNRIDRSNLKDYSKIALKGEIYRVLSIIDDLDSRINQGIGINNELEIILAKQYREYYIELTSYVRRMHDYSIF